MNRETELDYVVGRETSDDVKLWNSESGYFRGLGEDGQSTWVDAFKEVLPAVASVYQQDQFMKANLALINAGKPPLSATQYNELMPATAKVQVGPTDDAKKWIVYAGIGLLALVGLRAAKVI